MAINSRTPDKHNFPAEKRCSVVFSLSDEPGSLNKALKFFDVHGVNLTRIESRPAKQSADYMFFVDFHGEEQDENVQQLLLDLRLNCSNVTFAGARRVPWFPRKFADLDMVANQIMSAGADLESDHPGFQDKEYRARRAVLAQNAMDYRVGQKIPRIEYTQDELNTWSTVYKKLMPLHLKHACKEHVNLIPLL
jgi:phenylalanine-4-hydroxylase